MTLPPGVTAPALNEIQNAKNEAVSHMQARMRGMQDVAADNVRRQAALDLDRQRIEAGGTTNPELETIARATDRYAAIWSEIQGTPMLLLADQLDPAPTTGPRAREFTPAELDAGQSIAFVNMQNWIFAHREDTSANGAGRDTSFRRNRDIVTQNVLRDQMVAWFGRLGVPPPPGGGPITTFDQAAWVLRRELTAGTIIREHQLARFLTQDIIMNYMAPRVPAIT